MTGTEWPAYQVFKQDRADAPHENVGTVHAPDAEMALMNARDVFVRRPECISLWVAPESDITSRTAEELNAGLLQPPAPAGVGESYQVFKKVHQRGSHVHAGTMQAVSAVEALRRAREAFADPPGLVWWVVPERSLARTERGDTPELFEGARDKLYRDQAFYFPDMLLRQLRKEQSATRGMPRGRKGGV